MLYIASFFTLVFAEFFGIIRDLFTMKHHRIGTSLCNSIGSMLLGTSNIAEWTGCIEAMSIAEGLRKVYPEADIKVFSDSQLISYQFNGKYAIKEQSFIPFHQKAIKYAHHAQIDSINWIKREFNTEADRLSKVGLKELKKFWYIHIESDSCFTATEKEFEELLYGSGDLCQIREVYSGETDKKDANRIWGEVQAGRLKKTYV